MLGHIILLYPFETEEVKAESCWMTFLRLHIWSVAKSNLSDSKFRVYSITSQRKHMENGGVGGEGQRGWRLVQGIGN